MPDENEITIEDYWKRLVKGGLSGKGLNIWAVCDSLGTWRLFSHTQRVADRFDNREETQGSMLRNRDEGCIINLQHLTFYLKPEPTKIVRLRRNGVDQE